MEKISTAEFEIMRVIWANQPVMTKDIIEILHQTQDWSDSTIKTLLSRLVKKDFVVIDHQSSKYRYISNIDKNQYIETEMKNLLEKVCDTTKMKIIISLIEDLDISSQDLEILTNILNKKSIQEKVECHCPKGLCDYEKI